MAIFSKIMTLFKNIFRLKKSRRAKPRKGSRKSSRSSISKKKKNIKRNSPKIKIQSVKPTSSKFKKTVPNSSISQFPNLKEKKIVPKKLPQKELKPGPLIGAVTHFFPRIQVCVLKVSGNSIKQGDKILIIGKDRCFQQSVQSLQIESLDVKSAKRGDLVGLKLVQPAGVGDKVFAL